MLLCALILRGFGRMAVNRLQAYNKIGRLTTPARFVLVLGCLAILPTGGYGQAQSSPDCRPLAYLAPMATLGGPAVAGPHETELGLAFGGYSFILPSPCIHVGGLDWIARWRRGIGHNLDVGFDFFTNSQADQTLAGGAKVAIRYQVTQGFRLEAGGGAVDGGDGRNGNIDLGAVIGTHNADKAWNYYAALRLGASRGCLSCGGNTNHAPGGVVPLGTIGATARVTDGAKFVMEGALGGAFANQYSSPAPYVQVFFGMLFNVGKDRK